MFISMGNVDVSAMNKGQVTTTGIFVAMLQVLFIGLKLAGHIDWSWWWVLAPLWLQFPIALIIIIVALIVAYVKGEFE